MNNPESGSNIHYYILRQHGRDVLKRLRNVERTSEKLARWRNHRVFNLRCSHSNIIPNHVKLKSNITGTKAVKVVNKAEKRLLNIRIAQCNFTIRKLENERDQLLEEICKQAEDFRREITDHINNIYERMHTRTKDKQQAKFDHLREKNIRTSQDDTTTVDTERWVVNLSNKTLDEHENKVLKRGLNFAVVETNIPIVEIITSTEQACSKIVNKSKSDALRSEVTKILKSKRTVHPNISLEERKALQRLKQDNTIQILPADKGRATVLLDKTDYERKIDQMLSDSSTYVKLQKDPTSKYKNRLTKLLKILKDNNKITIQQWKHMYPTSEDPPKFYGLPKIHKPGTPLRPIVSSMGSITYFVAKYLAEILSPLVGKSNHHIKNSTHFVNKIKDIEVTPGQKMVSYDVTALFTSIPVDDALKATEEHLNKDMSWKANTKLSKDEILELLDICLSSTYFIYKGQFYKQIKGTAMGSPISPIIANLYMEKFELKAINSAPSQPRVWFRYVDDTFCILHQYDIDGFTKHLNHQDPNIKFTIEQETDNKLAFLDVCINLNDDASINTTIYRKKTHTDQYLNFNSNHHLEHKRSVVRTLMNRADQLITNEEDREQERDYVKTVLKANGYKQWMFKLPNKQLNQEKTSNRNSPRDSITVGLPYTKGLSEHLQRIFKVHNVHVYHRPRNNIRSMLVHPKDKTKITQKSGVVYEVTCKNCMKKYIGETGRPLEKRLEEHRKLTSSAIHEHTSSTGHIMDWKNVKVLASEQNEIRRKVKESIWIRKKKPDLNRDAGLDLPPIYNDLLSHDLRSCDM